MQIDSGDAGIIGTIVAVLLSIGGLIHKIKSHGKQIRDLQEAVAAIPRRFHDRTGLPIYRSGHTCEKLREECAVKFEKNIDELRNDIKLLLRLHMKNGANREDQS